MAYDEMYTYVYYLYLSIHSIGLNMNSQATWSHWQCSGPAFVALQLLHSVAQLLAPKDTAAYSQTAPEGGPKRIVSSNLRIETSQNELPAKPSSSQLLAESLALDL